MKLPLIHSYCSVVLCRHNDKVLLLLRNSRNNNNTWGLPGGNYDQGDADLMHTATREGNEEMGALPEFEVLSEIKTRYDSSQLSPESQESQVLNAKHFITEMEFCLWTA